ncbi:DUF3466 family protein [Thalassotalea agarivorans]|uniref:DUF3466 family protein n=1 Tax=Thalassotalea agarivorans TaxID=349064 RepID=A0A1I0D7G3_THASX|nr:DUF3466 family protein [Thalassotalea agarivorans]SET28000.1 Protein of unknown function [Thalassotalea agarivorans]
MKKFTKSVLAASILSTLCFSAANAAKYTVVDKGEVNGVKFTYGQASNNAGEMAISGTNILNFPVQFEYISDATFDLIFLYAQSNAILSRDLEPIEDFEALKAGNPTANDLAWTVLYLNANASNPLFQKVGAVVAMYNAGAGSTTEEIAVFDKVFEGTGDLTRSTTDYVNGISNGSWLYGTASSPYVPIDHTTEVYDENGDVVESVTRTMFVKEFALDGEDGFITRGYLYSPSGDLIPVRPFDQTYGGISAVSDYNDDAQIAVGYASTEINETVLEVIESDDFVEINGQSQIGCKNPDSLNLIPFEVCVETILLSTAYSTEATKWTIDPVSGTTEVELLGKLITEQDEDDLRSFVSYAQKVNSSGVAVGYAEGWFNDNRTGPRDITQLYAVVYRDGKVLDFNENKAEYFNSRAYDINDNGIAVGHTSHWVNGSIRTSFYYVDTNEEQPTLVMPKDFFVGSASTARAINIHGQVVGEGEVEFHNDSGGQKQRRRNAFLYDIESDTFTNVNDLLSCEQRLDYTIVEARDIDDNGGISATALIKAPRLDAKGEPVEGVFDDVLRAVYLQTTDGEIEDCAQDDEKYERQGAGMGILATFMLSLFAIRRRLFK